jgi:DNA-binding beta-propeller fold protein YncE
VSLDYLFFEPERARVWVPAGGSGSVDVFDIAAHAFTRVEGFKTVHREIGGKMRTLGPSSGSIGEGVAYVGNRATQEVCVVDLLSLKKRFCLKLPSAPDGVEFCRQTREVWVTIPSRRALWVLDAAQPGELREKAVVQVEGEPEGYAVDEAHGLFLTNLEDEGSTLGIDLKTRQVKEVWKAGCSSEGPRGLAVDSARGLVMVACTDHVQVLDQGKHGALLGRLDTGAGVDNIDYAEGSRLLYVAAGKAARLTVARLEDDGQLSVTASGATAPGARNAVADTNGNAYVADGQGARLLLLGAAVR